MENIVTTLKVKCAEAGTNLTEVCRKAKVARSTVDRWEVELPKSFRVLAALEKAIEEIKSERSA